MSGQLFRLHSVNGTVVEGHVQGNGGPVSSVDVMRREVAIVEGREEGCSRIYQPSPGTCKVHLRGEGSRAYDDPKGSTVLRLHGLIVEEIHE